MASALILVACAGPNPATGPTDEALRVALAESLVVTGKLARSETVTDVPLSADQHLQLVYETRNFKPIWVGPGGANERAQILLTRLSDVETDALNPQRYELAGILEPLAAGDVDSLASAELYFSRALMRYAADLQGLDEADAEIVAAAGSAADFRDYLDSLIPPDPGYRRLRAAMRLYRGIAAEGGWPVIADGPLLREGVSDPRVLQLRHRLGATGDLPAADARAESVVFDETMAAALRRFQARHGLQADGIAGRRTLDVLNRPVEEKIAQIAHNLAQHRVQPQEFGDRAVVVNIAAQELVVIDEGEEVLRSRTIVGRPGWETPQLSSQIHAIEVNPTWTVPRKIALEEILPQAREDGPGYFGQRGYRLFDAGMQPVDPADISWERIDNGLLPYILRQDAGAKNALGRVKFLFPNGQDIYLHDTPGRALFKRPTRAFSHGCVRVEKAEELAVLLLRMGSGWSVADYRRALRSGETKRIMLDAPVALYLISISAWVDTDGTVQFRSDPYRREAPNTLKRKPDSAGGNFL